MDNLGGYLKHNISTGFYMNIAFENILEVSRDIVEVVRNWRNSKTVSQYMYTNHYITKEEHLKWIGELKNKDIAKAWIIKYNGKPVGLVSLSNINYINKTTEWGLYIADGSARGKGIGSVVLYKLMEYVFEEMKFNKMSTMVLENNIIAIGLYKKFGFKKEGEIKEKLVRNGKYIEVILMGILQEKWINIKEKLNVTISSHF